MPRRHRAHIRADFHASVPVRIVSVVAAAHSGCTSMRPGCAALTFVRVFCHATDDDLFEGRRNARIQGTWSRRRRRRACAEDLLKSQALKNSSQKNSWPAGS